jgi:uncharacterized membrane protein
MYYRPRAHAVIGLNFLIISKTAFRQIIPMAPMPHCATTSIATATVSGKFISYKQQYAVVTVTANTALNSTVCLVNQVSDVLALAYTRQRHKLVDRMSQSKTTGPSDHLANRRFALQRVSALTGVAVIVYISKASITK